MTKKSTHHSRPKKGAGSRDISPNKKSTVMRRRIIWISAVLGSVLIIVVAAAIYADRVAPFRTTVITVNGNAVSMDMFLKRIYISDAEPMSMLQVLSDEEIVNQVAPAPPYNIEVSEKDVDNLLRTTAQGESESLTESDFKEWYRQQINESRMSEQEFIELVRTSIYIKRLGDYLAAKVPTVAEQVHLFMVPIEGLNAAREAKARIDEGESFAAIVGEYSVDEGLKQSGGDMGWLPREVLIPIIARNTFDELSVGQVSDPLYLDDELFTLVMVSERVAARELDENARRRMQETAFENWIRDERKMHDIQFYGFRGPYSSQTDDWVKWQLSRMDR